MDAENVLLLTYMSIGAIIGIAYSVFSYMTKVEPATFEVKRFVASVFFGIMIGAIGGYSAMSTSASPEEVEWWGLMATLFLTYSGAMVYVNKFVDYLWVWVFGEKLGATKWFYKSWVLEEVSDITEEEKTSKLAILVSALGSYYRKMSESRRHNMVFDQPVNLQQMILDCVDSAESKTTWRYAVRGGSWEYLIEYGILTGAKNYTYWNGGKVEWKPISVETLESIRKTGKFPEYSQLT
jgi:hypothetical protein